MATKQSRSVPFKVTITPELHERLREVAAQLGQAPATVASLAIGQYVAQMGRTFGAVQTATDALVKQMGPELTQAMEQLKLAASPVPKKAPKRVTR